MVAGSGFSSLFGPSPIAPANPSYEPLTIAANTALTWPTETTGGTPYVATQIDVTASVGGLSLAMPPGNTGSSGGGALITNVGANTFTVTDTAGNQIVQIATTQMWLVTLTDNSTVNGTWRAYQLASTTSSATAASLAGPGLQAIGSLLQTIWSVSPLSVDTLITAAYRSRAVEWQGAAGSLQLDSIANLTVGWFAGLSNLGTGDVTVSTTGGATINGAATLTLHPGNSGLIICGAGGFITLGAIIGVLPITDGGTGASTAGQALTNLGGTSIGKSIFTSPSAAAVKSLLDIQDFALIEASINTNQTLNEASSGTIFVSTTAPLTLTLPLVSTVGNTFFFMLKAFVDTTLTPQPTDTIAGFSVGVSYLLRAGGSVLFCCDGVFTWVAVFDPTSAQASLGDIKETGLPEALLASLAPGWHICDGSTRPRTDPLWVATGAVNPAYWVFGNGNGTTTYTLPDRRGRVAIGRDNMGGTPANRITTGGSNFNGLVLGAVGGDQSLQQHSHTATNTDPGHVHNITDPGHSHGVNDPGHHHTFSLVNDGGSGSLAGGRTGSAAPSGTTTDNATGITINLNGIGIAAVDTNTTSLTTAIANSGTGGSQNVQPGLIENIIIFTGA